MGWIALRGGASFDFDKIDVRGIWSKRSISRTLSRIYRFNGHTRWPYTVAQHSVLVSRLLRPNPAKALVGLLHDVPEVFIGDIVGPLKKTLPGISELEEKIWNAIAVFHLLDHTAIHSQWLKKADLELLVAEARDLLENCSWIGAYPESSHPTIEPWHPEYAADIWLREYCALTCKLN